MDKERSWNASKSGSAPIWKVIIVGGYIVDDETPGPKSQTCRLLLTTESGDLFDAPFHEVRLTKEGVEDLWSPYR